MKNVKKNEVKVEFRQDKLGFTVIFYRKTDEELEKVANLNIVNDVGLSVGLNETQKEILEKITKNKEVKQAELAEKLNTSKRSIERNMDKLKEKGIIRRVGSKKIGYWEVNL